jgi:predicted AlkP superfamily pyrophosphatase or phosphodiesterase
LDEDGGFRAETAMAFRILLACTLAFALAACATSPGPPSAPHAVVLVSIDGFRADYLERDITPTLAALARSGVRAEALKPAFPTLTFPNHYTLVTGITPDHHGIVANRFRDPATGARFDYKDAQAASDPSWWGGEPLWISVERQGGHAATMFWPGSAVAFDGLRPSEWLPFDGRMTPDQRVDRLLGWLDLPPPRRPRFATLYFDQVDHAGHEHGPDSREVDQALRGVDSALARFTAGLRARGRFTTTDLVIVSDHGMAAVPQDHRIDLGSIVPLADVDVVTYGPLTGIEPHADRRTDAERALLAPHAHMQCRRKAHMPARLRYGANPREAAFLCLADDGWTITSAENEARRTHPALGEHGYDNDDPAMRALFIAHGPDFRTGLVVPEFDSVDVYPLLARLLRIHPQPNDGDPATTAPMLRGP